MGTRQPNGEFVAAPPFSPGSGLETWRSHSLSLSHGLLEKPQLHVASQTNFVYIKQRNTHGDQTKILTQIAGRNSVCE